MSAARDTAPEASAELRAAEDALLKEAAIAERYKDGTAEWIRATAAAVHGIRESLSQHAQLIQQAKTPFSKSDLERLAREASDASHHHSRQAEAARLKQAVWENVRSLAIAGLLILVAGVAIGYGYRWWAVPSNTTYVLNGFYVTDAKQCHEQDDGATTCMLPIMQTPPTEMRNKIIADYEAQKQKAKR